MSYQNVQGGLSGSQHSFLDLMDHASHGAKSTHHPCASFIQGLRECLLFQAFIQRLGSFLLLQAFINVQDQGPLHPMALLSHV